MQYGNASDVSIFHKMPETSFVSAQKSRSLKSDPGSKCSGSQCDILWLPKQGQRYIFTCMPRQALRLSIIILNITKKSAIKKAPALLNFKLLLCSECCMLYSGWFTGVCSLYANVSEHCVCSILIHRYDFFIPSINSLKNKWELTRSKGRNLSFIQNTWDLWLWKHSPHTRLWLKGHATENRKVHGNFQDTNTVAGVSYSTHFFHNHSWMSFVWDHKSRTSWMMAQWCP
jgi:hypothetical protein